MKKFLTLFLLLANSIIFSCKSQQYPELGPQEFSKAVADSNAILLDVRTPEEYQTGHLKNARLIDFYEDNFYSQIATLDKSKTVYLYCRSGSRSGQAQEKMLKELGFKKVINLKGGIQDWKNAGLPIEK
jgi:rhodanese-related sulfurtransferase